MVNIRFALTVFRKLVIDTAVALPLITSTPLQDAVEAMVPAARDVAEAAAKTKKLSAKIVT